MGTATMNFKEGIIVSGSAANPNLTESSYSLVNSGTMYNSDDIEVDGDIILGQYLKHAGDTDTFIRLQDDKMTFEAGGMKFLRFEEVSSFGNPEQIVFNESNNDIDVTFKGTSSTILQLEATNHRVGIGTGSPSETLDVSGIAKATSIRTALLEYTDGDDAITIEDGGFLRLNAGIKYARGVLVSASTSPDEVGGWIKFATFNCPGGSSLDTAASSFFITFAGMESAGNRRIDGQFIVHAKFTVNTGGTGTDGASVSNAYYEPEGTRISCEPMQAEFLAANGASAFDPSTDLLMIFTNSSSTPTVDLYIKCNAKKKHCFVTHLGGTGQVNTSDTDIGWEINTDQSWSSSEPTAPSGSVKLSGTFVSKIFSGLGIATSSPIAELDVAGKIAITSESSTPSQPADGQGYIYSKSDGKLYWRSYDLSETELTAAGGGGSPAGSDTQIQFNDGGSSFGASANLTWDDTALKISGTGTNAILSLETTEDSSTASPVFTLKRNSSSPADADYLGQLKFQGENDADQNVTYAKITGKIGSVVDGSEQGIIEFANMKNGSSGITARLRHDSLQLVNSTNLTVDGVIGVGTTSPLTKLDVHHDPTGLSNNTGGGEVVKFGTGTLTTGKLYYLNASSAWTEADADAVASGADQLLGIALGSSPSSNGVLIRGFFDATSYLSNFTAGKAVYISTTAGGMDTTAPSGGGDFVRVVGYCTTTANVIYFNPSSAWVEL